MQPVAFEISEASSGQRTFIPPHGLVYNSVSGQGRGQESSSGRRRADRFRSASSQFLEGLSVDDVKSRPSA
eukprot:12302548-Alexandrium_andersonii.AAC.1